MCYVRGVGWNWVGDRSVDFDAELFDEAVELVEAVETDTEGAGTASASGFDGDLGLELGGDLFFEVGDVRGADAAPASGR